jgi:hypothetical protein
MKHTERAEQIYSYMNFNFVAAESAICLLHQHGENKDYWVIVWEALIDKYGEHWQKLQFEYQREDYINACTL